MEPQGASKVPAPVFVIVVHRIPSLVDPESCEPRTHRRSASADLGDPDKRGWIVMKTFGDFYRLHQQVHEVVDWLGSQLPVPRRNWFRIGQSDAQYFQSLKKPLESYLQVGEGLAVTAALIAVL